MPFKTAHWGISQGSGGGRQINSRRCGTRQNRRRDCGRSATDGGLSEAGCTLKHLKFKVPHAISVITQSSSRFSFLHSPVP